MSDDPFDKVREYLDEWANSPEMAGRNAWYSVDPRRGVRMGCDQSPDPQAERDAAIAAAAQVQVLREQAEYHERLDRQPKLFGDQVFTTSHHAEAVRLRRVIERLEGQ